MGLLYLRSCNLGLDHISRLLRNRIHSRYEIWSVQKPRRLAGSLTLRVCCDLQRSDAQIDDSDVLRPVHAQV